jgi:hypothetical protein
MLPHRGCWQAEKAKMRRVSFSLTLNPLQNHGLTNLQDHGYNDSAVRRNFRKAQKSALILEKVLKAILKRPR